MQKYTAVFSISLFSVKDTNFDNMTQKFANNIYGTLKGEIRTAVLWRDLKQAIPNIETKKLTILDAGGGFGHLSQQLAALGHKVVLCDISSEMLALAKQQIAASDKALNIELVHSSLQQLSAEQYGQFDVILCHAVAEWLTDAKTSLAHLLTLLKADGLFSLMFYNKQAMCFHALVSANFDYVAADFKIKKKVRLTPTHPLYIDDVQNWFNEWQLEVISKSGVRVIHDYLKTNRPHNFDPQKLLQMELAFSTQEPYLSLGRYVHFIGKPKQ